MNLLTGPPGSGKTTRLLGVARNAAARGERVWWVGLPSQRSYVYQRLAERGAVLGIEFLSSQQVYYRLLAHALRLKPLLVGTGRIALVGEALKRLRNELPSPGEARLFTRAIAEAKRFGLTWQEVAARDLEDGEVARFRSTLRLYEELKQDTWDYDDFRLEALHLALAGHARPEADLIIVDGFRELGPLELRLYKTLSRGPGEDNAKQAEVWLSLPEPPPGEVSSHTATLTDTCAVQTYRAPNPVAESRWVLRTLKRDLANGYAPLDLAVILPEREVRAFLSLADEYGVPMMDETPKALAETPQGRLLLDLLELPDYPTASRLLAIPELAPLAKAALKRGVAGREALTRLAEEVSESASWRAWLSRLEVPDGELEWAQDLVESLPEVSAKSGVKPGFDWGSFSDHALERAKEAAQLASGAQFRAWWGALLQETFLFSRPRGGVALLTAKLASGRRFRRAYLAHATDGAYTVGEAEDYFVPEEARAGLKSVFSTLGLPKRFLGRDEGLFAELLSRGDEVIVTYPEADQGGPLVPETALAHAGCARLPEVAAGSRLELGSANTFSAPLAPLNLGTPSVQALSRYAECGFRYWAERRVAQDDPPWWAQLVRDLREQRKFNAARLGALSARYPDAATWLAQVEADLAPLTFGVSLPEGGDGPFARLDAAGRSGQEMRLYTFVRPDAWSREDAESWLRKPHRWSELWAAGHLLEAYGPRISGVRLFVWPVLGEPIDVFDAPIAYVWRQIAARQQKADRAFRQFVAGDVSPKPGFVCRECRVFDLCRAGQR